MTLNAHGALKADKLATRSLGVTPTTFSARATSPSVTVSSSTISTGSCSFNSAYTSGVIVGCPPVDPINERRGAAYAVVRCANERGENAV